MPALIAPSTKRSAPLTNALSSEARNTTASATSSMRPRRPSGELWLEPGEGTLGASAGRSGELRDELRLERLEGDRIRLARWIMRPNRGWELQDAPVMLPPSRFAEAFSKRGGPKR